MDDTTTLFTLLAADHRRRILFLLCDSDSIQVPEGLLPRGQTCSAHPRDTRSDSSRVQFSSSAEEIRKVEIQLRHHHLPKLEETGVIEWDQDTDIVSRGPRFDDFEPLLRLLAANQHRFPDALCGFNETE